MIGSRLKGSEWFIFNHRHQSTCSTAYEQNQFTPPPFRPLDPGGFIAIDNLDAKDGSFHEEDTGVFHHGFNRKDLAEMARAAGFKELTVTDASVIHKPHGDFPIFLLKGMRKV